MKYKCACGNIHYISLDNFKKGKRCKQCGLNKLAENFKHDVEYIKQFFIDNNCIPLFTEYVNTHTPLKYVCECGNTSKIAFADFQSGKRCDACRIQRIHETMYKNGTQMCSAQQKHIHNLLGGELNYPVHNASLDIAFPQEKVYIEYNGSGHNLSVKLGDISQKDFDEKEKRRTYGLYRDGWKNIKIISKQDRLPSEHKIKDIIQYALDYFSSGHSWITFDLDNSQIKKSTEVINYNYGKLSRLVKFNYV